MKGREEKEAIDIFVRDVGMRGEGTQKFSNLCAVATTRLPDRTTCVEKHSIAAAGRSVGNSRIGIGNGHTLFFPTNPKEGILDVLV